MRVLNRPALPRASSLRRDRRGGLLSPVLHACGSLFARAAVTVAREIARPPCLTTVAITCAVVAAETMHHMGYVRCAGC